MIINLEQVLSLVNEPDIKSVNFDEYTMCYRDAHWLSGLNDTLEKGNIYFGLASMFPEKLPKYDVGLVFINDTGKEFSSRSLGMIELSPTVNLEALYKKTRGQMKILAEEQASLENLLVRLFKNKSIKEILDLGHDFLQNPIAIFTESNSYSAALYSSMGDIVSEINSRQENLSGKEDKSTVLEIFFNGQQRMESAPLPVLLSDGVNFSGKRRIASWLQSFTRGDQIGAITLFEFNKPFDGMDFIYVEILSRIISEKLNSFDMHNDYHKIMYEQNMHDLISGKAIAAGDRWLSIINGNRYQNFLIILLDSSNLSLQEYNKVRTDISFRFCYNLIIRRGSYMVIWANPKNEKEELALEKYLLDIAEKYQLTFGFSDFFNESNNLQRHYIQAKKAREIGMKMKRRGRIHKFKELKYYVLLEEMPGTCDLDLFISRDYQKLREHDLAKGTEYCQTLRCFISNGADRQVVCRLLNIHRNTLPQRLEKIEALLGHSITENDYLIDIYLSDFIENYQLFLDESNE